MENAKKAEALNHIRNHFFVQFSRFWLFSHTGFLHILTHGLLDSLKKKLFLDHVGDALCFEVLILFLLPSFSSIMMLCDMEDGDFVFQQYKRTLLPLEL